jgi:phosphatidate cytidylyltransferase
LKALSNFWVRLIFGALFVSVLTVASLAGSSWLTFFVIVISSFSISEFLKMQGQRNPVNLAFAHLSNLIILGFPSGWFGLLPFASQNTAIFVLLALGVVFMTVHLFKSGTDLYAGTAPVFMGLVYISLPFLLFLSFAGLGTGYDARKALLVFILVWSSDTFAYVAGRLFGKHPLYAELSPKKTIEGFIGGTILAAGAGALLSLWWEFITLTDGLALGALVSIFGTAGDLFESGMKRKAGIKDSGRFIPGHGGALDRFDAFLFAAVVVYVWFGWQGI